MSYPVETLEPTVVWKYFDRIRQIPRGSGNEAALGQAILSWAHDCGCETDRDQTGNIVVRVPASAGCENAPIIVIQGHLDMVCEKNAEREFDFEKDPIELVRNEDWIAANGTTLGADNGIGLAIALSYLESSAPKHGPLELLFTVNEETGLVGARALQPNFVQGRLLFNLDSEEDGVFYVGCAGGKDSDVELAVNRRPVPENLTGFTIEVKGLRGGHSGLDIVHNRGNATRLLTRALQALSERVELALVSISGGDKHNAIPREATAVAFIDPAGVDAAEQVLKDQLDKFQEEFQTGEPDIALTMTPNDAAGEPLDAKSQQQVLGVLLGLPHGVLAMCRDVPGMVETSSNMARVRVEEDKLAILNSTRSSVGAALDGAITQLSAVARLAGASFEADEGYPAWKPNMESSMLAKAREMWKKVHQSDAEFTIIHAGLECGIIGEKYSGMDMISIGPTIEFAHSPEERVSITSVARLYEFVWQFIEELARG